MVSPDATATRRGRHAPGGGAPLFLVGPLYTPSLILSCSLFSSLEILHLFHFHDALKTGLPHALVERGDPSWLESGEAVGSSVDQTPNVHPPRPQGRGYQPSCA